MTMRVVLFLCWLSPSLAHEDDSHVLASERKTEHETELVFELPHAHTSCFTETFFGQGINFTFEWQVMEEGSEGIQVWVATPTTDYIYNKKSLLKDIFTFFTKPGEWTFCFENKESLLATSKRVYFLLQSTDQSNMAVAMRGDDRPGAGGFLETASDSIWLRLLKVKAEQREYRLGLDKGRKFAQNLNSRIQTMGMVITSGVLAVGLGQTLFLKRLFNTGRRGLESGTAAT